MAASVLDVVIKTAVPTKAEQVRKWRFSLMSSCFGRSEAFERFEFSIVKELNNGKIKSMQEKNTGFFATGILGGS
jgi:hypothetical protein